MIFWFICMRRCLYFLPRNKKRTKKKEKVFLILLKAFFYLTCISFKLDFIGWDNNNFSPTLFDKTIRIIVVNPVVFLHYKMLGQKIQFYFPSHKNHSRGSSISSDDFSSITSPELLIEKSFYTKKAKLKKKLKGAQNKADKMSMNEKSNGSSGSGHGKSPTLLKRRYSVPEIIMRK